MKLARPVVDAAVAAVTAAVVAAMAAAVEATAAGAAVDVATAAVANGAADKPARLRAFTFRFGVQSSRHVFSARESCRDPVDFLWRDHLRLTLFRADAEP